MPSEDLDRECHCVIHEPPGNRGGWDDGDRKLVADVERHGWGVFGINADGSLPGWAFTAGLWHSLGSPEVAMFGLLVPDMQSWLNDLGEQIRGGLHLRENEAREGILPDFPVTFRPVHTSWYRDLFGYALWFAQRPPLPILQVVWPDRHGRFPWHPDCGERCRFDQPQLWLAKDEHPMGRWTRVAESDPWPFPDSPATRAFTTKRIAFEGRDVVYVVHDEDGDWQFLDGEDVTPDDGVLVHLEHVVGAHPRVADLGDLPRGWEAWQEPPGGDWIRRARPPHARR